MGTKTDKYKKKSTDTKSVFSEEEKEHYTESKQQKLNKNKNIKEQTTQSKSQLQQQTKTRKIPVYSMLSKHVNHLIGTLCLGEVIIKLQEKGSK